LEHLCARASCVSRICGSFAHLALAAGERSVLVLCCVLGGKCVRRQSRNM